MPDVRPHVAAQSNSQPGCWYSSPCASCSTDARDHLRMPFRHMRMCSQSISRSCINRNREYNSDMISETVSIILGAVICFLVPTLCLSAGIYIGRHGMPFEIHWKRGRSDDE
jgi:hypothetical protein